MKFGVGQSVKRVEDVRLLTGKGRFTDDLQASGALYAATLRSPYGHARIARIDTAAALVVPGVVAVYTHADVAELGVVPCLVPLSGKVTTPRHMLTGDTVRFVGDGVAFIVAETREAARLGADAVVVDYDELPAVASIEAAIAPGAPKIWDAADSNSLFDWNVGDKDKAADGIAAAAHVTRLRIVQNRIAPTSMEVRAAVGHFDAEGGYTLEFGGQGVASARNMVAGLLKVEPSQVRIITGDVGGGFGMKTFVYGEYVLVLHAAKRIGSCQSNGPASVRTRSRPTRMAAPWSATRLWASMKMRARSPRWQIETWSDLGAYQAQFGPAIQTMAGGRIMGGVYRIPAIHNHRPWRR